MKPTLDEAAKRVAAGESLDDLLASVRPAAEAALMLRLALPRVFDRTLIDDVLRPSVEGATADEVPWERLIGRSEIVRLAGTEGWYRLRDGGRESLLSRWVPVVGTTPERGDPPADGLRLHKVLAEHFERLGSQWNIEALYHRIASSPDDAWTRFEQLWTDAEGRFDLARCQALIDAAEDALQVFAGPDRERARQDLAARRARLRARSFWSDEFFRSGRYLRRPDVDDAFERLLGNDAGWMLQVIATGGMGKSIFTRHAIARVAVPRGIPCARIDFDSVEHQFRGQLWPLAAELARQLDTQIEHGPLREIVESAHDLARGDRLSQSKAGTRFLQQKGEDILFRFQAALGEIALERRLLLVLDTLERPLFDPGADLVRILEYLHQLHARRVDVRVLLAGRYDLHPHDAQLAHLIDSAGTTVSIPPFDRGDARAYLTDKRRLPDDERLGLVIERSGGLPFKLALYADLLQTNPAMQVEELAAYGYPDLLYLIERVVERIDDPKAQWLLRYGVIPRRLTLDFVRDVMSPYLPDAMTGKADYDDPARDLPHALANKRVFPIGTPSAAYEALDLEALWQTLRRYASSYAWVSESKDDASALVFHGEVLHPMRRLLAAHPVFGLLHRDAARYCERRAEAEPERWARWTVEAIYHKFQMDGTAAEIDWHRCLDAARAHSRADWMRSVAGEVLGSEYLDDSGQPLTRFDGRPMMSDSFLATVHFEYAAATVAMARSPDYESEEAIWMQAQRAYAAFVKLRSRGVTVSLPQSRLARLEAALLAAKGDRAAALERLSAPLDANPDATESARLAIDRGELLADVEPWRAAVHYEEAVRAALAARSPDEELVATAAFGLAQQLLAVDRLLDAARTLDDLLGRLATPPRHRARARILQSAVYLSAGRPSAAETAAVSEDVAAGPIDARIMGLYARASSLVSAGNPVEALQVASEGRRMVAEWSGQQPVARSRQSSTLDIAGAAIAATARAALLDPSAASALESAMDAYQRLGAFADAARLRLRLVQFYIRDIGNLVAADQLLQVQAVAPAPGLSAEESLLRAEWLARTGRTSDACSLLDEVLASPDRRAPSLMVRIAVEGLIQSPDRTESSVAQLIDTLLTNLRRIRPASERIALLKELRRCAVLPPLRRRIGKVQATLSDDRGFSPIEEADRTWLDLRLVDVDRVFGRAQDAKQRVKAILRRLATRGPVFLMRDALLAADRAGAKVEAEAATDPFLSRFASYPALSAAFLVEQAERLWSGGSSEAAEQLLARAEQLVSSDAQLKETQWMPRILALQSQIAERRRDPDVAASALQRAADGYLSLGDHAARLALRADDLQTRAVFVDVPATATLRVAGVTGGFIIEADAPGAEHSVSIPVTWNEYFSGRPDVRADDRASRFRVAEAFAKGWFEACDVVWEKVFKTSFWSRVYGAAAKQRTSVCLRLEVAPSLGYLPWEVHWTRALLAARSESPSDVFNRIALTYRSGAASRSVAERVKVLQAALRSVVAPTLAVDGVVGRRTREAVRTFQKSAGLEETGFADAETRMELQECLRAALAVGRPSVLILKASHARQKRRQRGETVYMMPLEQAYSMLPFEVRVIDNPSEMEFASFASSSASAGPVAVIHVVAGMSEAPGTGGASLDFGRADELGDSDPESREASFGFSPRSIASLVRRVSTDISAPLVILDAPVVPTATELARQCFLRNEFATELFNLGGTPGVLAIGLGSPRVQEGVYSRLIDLLRRAACVGDIIEAIREHDPIGARTSLDRVLGTAGAMLLAHDPRWIPFDPRFRSAAR